MTAPNYLLQTQDLSVVPALVGQLAETVQLLLATRSRLVLLTRAPKSPGEPDPINGFLATKFQLHATELSDQALAQIDADCSDIPDPAVRERARLLRIQNAQLRAIRARQLDQIQDTKTTLAQYTAALEELVAVLRDEVAAHHLEAIHQSREQALQLARHESAMWQEYHKLLAIQAQAAQVAELFAPLLGETNGWR